ncbi:MAG: hypothetical protein MJ252_27655 [archaeon]|nr:hypothetical protein [archaeon]
MFECKFEVNGLLLLSNGLAGAGLLNELFLLDSSILKKGFSSLCLLLPRNGFESAEFSLFELVNGSKLKINLI